MVKKKIKVPIYNQFNITIIISDNITEEVCKITKQVSEVNFIGVFCHKRGGLDLILGFQKKGLTQGTISHECLHAVCYIMDYIGMPLGEQSEEAYTYLLGHLVEEVNKLIK